MGPMTDLFVDLAEARIHVRDYGGDGPPLLMLHATGFGAWAWRALVPGLRGRFHLYAPEQRGHGDSSSLKDGYDFRSLAADLDGVCERLGLRDACGIGHSSGGAALLALAALHPGRVRRLLLIEPPLNLPSRRLDAAFPKTSSMVAQALRRRPGFASREAMFASYRLRPPFKSWREDILRAYCEEGTLDAEGGVLLKCPPAVEARFYEAVGSFDAREVCSRVAIPVRLLWGDEGFHGRGQAIAALLPAAESRVMTGASHYLPMEQPEAVVAQALEFFSEGRA